MDVAIVGIGCRFPGGADSPGTFWRLLSDGVDAITELPSDRFDLVDLFDADPATPGKMYTRWGGFLDRVDAFDADFFGIAPREARRMDPQQRLLLEVVWEALEEGGQVPDRLAGTNTGVFVGISTHDYVDVQVLPHNRHRIDPHINAGTAMCIAANRVSYLLDLHGPSFTVDTACSSSLTAVHLARRSLIAGECDLAIAGGVGVLLAPEVTVGFCKASMLSPTGRCRAFDAAADGYVRSEGSGAVVLKPLDRALSDGDPIHAVIRGTGINQDGRTTGLSLPSATAQRAMLERTLHDAGVAPADIQYVEAHGTGTPVGDPVEAEAIGQALSPGRAEDGPCLIGSVKTNLGHLEAAAGMAGLIKAALALEHRQIPPNLHLREPNPQIAFDELGLRVPTQLEPWPTAPGPAMAGVNSFGFGGANAHAVLQEPPARPVRHHAGRSSEGRGSADRTAYLLSISARSPEALRELADLHRQRLQEDTAVSLHDLCYSAAVRRSHHPERLGVVASSRDGFIEELDAFLDGQDPASVAVGRAQKDRSPELTFVFPGMGPQWWGMGRQLAQEEAVFRTTLEEVDGILQPLAGWSLLEQLSRDEGTSRIGEADLAHVANLAVQLGLAAVWRSWGVVPDAVVGHSSGEMAAACVSGALSLSEAVHLAFHRGRLQHRTTGTGCMLAAAISPEEAGRLIAGREHEVSLAAINAPGSVTLSGTEEVLGRIAETLTAQERFARFLPVQVPYHGPQMETIRGEFLEMLQGLHPRLSDIPLVSTVTGDWIDGQALDAAYWWRNVRQPVRFAAAMDRLATDDGGLFVELGPHPVLAPAVRECLAERGRSAEVLPTLRRGTSEVETMLRTLAALHVRGRQIQWPRVYPNGAFVPLPAYPWQRERHWFDDDEEAVAQPQRFAGVDTGHPLLGRRLPTVRPTWEVLLDGPDTAYLDAHVVQDTALFPGAGYLEMSLAAGRELWGQEPVVLEDVRFRRLLFLERPARGAVQLVHHPADSTVEIHSNPTGDGTTWTVHTSARLQRQEAGGDERLDLASLRARCTTPFSVDEHYRILEQRGYRFGGAFRTLREIWLGPDADALARVGFPPDIDLPVDGYQAHPALLDAAIQLFGAVSTLTADLERDVPFFPVSIRRLTFRRPPGARLWAYLVVRHRDDAAIEGDAWLLDDAGEVAVVLEGLRLQVLDEQRAVEPPSIDDWLYELEWEPAPLDRSGQRSLRPVPDIGAAVEGRNEPPGTATDVARYVDPVEPTLDHVALGFTLGALDAIGWTLDGDRGDQGDEVAAAHGVVPDHRRLFAALVARVRSSQTVHAGAAAVPRDRSELHDLLDELVAAEPKCAAEIELLRRGGDHLADILRGSLDAREVLLAGESLELLARFYDTSPGCRTYHALLADAVADAVAEKADSTRLRVLEIGAGTGAATAAVLEHLPSPVEYVFTDVSPLFLAEAQQRFGDRPGTRFSVLDIESDPVAQGFEPHSFDLVLAANVLHVTADLDTTLQHVRRLLAGNGILAVVELTRASGWLNLVFGLLEGWWRFADAYRRPQGPMLDAPEWQDVLERNGFGPVTAVFGDDEPGPQSLLLAQAPAPPRPVPSPARPPRHWVIFADETGAARSVGEQLVAAGDRCTQVRPGPGYRRHGDGSVTVKPTDAADYARLLEGFAESDAPDGIVHLWSLDAPAGEDVDAASLMAAQELGCGSVLALTQALDGASMDIADLWLVTAGAQAVDGVDAAPNVTQSALWGLGRMLMSEDAQTRCRLVDLGAELGIEDVAGLVAELSGQTGEEIEEEVALRDGARFIHRLRRTTLAEHAAHTEEQLRSAEVDGFRLEVGSPGALESLLLREAPPTEVGPGEVAVRVLASGLNFRDVLQTLDMLPPAAYQYGSDPEGLGIECAGIVVECGAGVERLRPGDEVIALAAAAHASRVVTREDLTVLKPTQLRFEEAASVLNAFVTAEYALHHVARIAEGERILIHSATGAVGLAAIQHCQRAGMEIFATAGTPEKRAHLRELGIEHVMGSRSVAFADEVLRATGGEGVDVVLNSLTGEAMRKSLSVLRPYGRFVELGKRDIIADAQVGLLPFQRNLSFHAVDLIQLALDRPDQARSLLEHVVGEIADGTLHVVPSSAFDLADAEAAFRLMAQARHIGKVVLTVDGSPYRVQARTETPLFDPDGTYLITGGLGGFGLAVAEWMASEGAGSLALMSRTGTPRHDAAALERLHATSTRVTVVTGDVSREEDVQRVLDRIRDELPPLRGVLHAAMVPDDERLPRFDQQRLREVLAPKVAGGWNLHRLTQRDDLDLFVLFSSIAAVVGNPLQGNYAAANAFLDVLPAYRQARGLPALTVGWGALTDVGYVSRRPELAQYLDRGGFRGLSPEQATDTLAQLLRHDVAHVIASPMDWRRWAELNSLAGSSRRFRDFVAADDASQTARSTEAADPLLALLRDAAPGDRAELLGDHVRRKVAKVLGASPEKLDPERPLTELGFDSLMAVELTTAFTADLGVRVPVVEVLQGTTSAELVDRLLRGLALDPPADGPPSDAQADGPASDAQPVAPANDARTPTEPDPGADPATGTGRPSEPGSEHPLSFEQRRFWFLDRLEPGNTTYNVPAAVRLEGALDVEALRDSLSEVLRRHDQLRSVFREVDGAPVQRFPSPEAATLPVVDLRDLPPRTRPAELAEAATADVQRPFDLGRGPLLRATLFRVDADEHVLLLVVHHIACDNQAVNLIVREMATLYEAFSAGRPSPLREGGVGYLDYIRHQQQRLAAVEESQLAYWRAQLSGTPSALGLPARSAPERRSGHGAQQPFELSAELTADLESLARREGVTLFVVLLAAFQTLLHRYTGAEDVAVGTAVSTRTEPGVGSVVGCFLNTVVLRSDLSGDPTFRGLLQRVKGTTLGAFEHQDVPFERVVEVVRPERDVGLNPLFEAMLVLQTARQPQLRVAGLGVQPMAVDTGTTIADLALLLDAGERIRGTLTYDTDRFDAGTIERMLGHLRTLLQGIAAAPERRLSLLPLLGDAERHQLLVGWNETQVDLGDETCLHELVEAQVERTPDAVAVRFEDTSVTYSELEERAEQLAHHLRGLGVGPDVLVGVYVPRSLEAVLAALAVLKAGGAYLPLHTDLPEQRLRYLLGDARPAVLLTNRALLDRLPEHGAEVVTLDDDRAWIDARRADGPAAVTSDDLAYVIYTSGSTGEPKGVQIPHRAICNQVRWRQRRFPLTEDDAVLQGIPLGFDPSVWELFGPLTAGATLVVPPPHLERDGARLLELIADRSVTTMQVVPSMLEALLEHPALDRCRALRRVFCGGEPLSSELAEHLISRLPVELHHLYGPTEATIDTTHWAGSHPDEHGGVLPIGRPIANARVLILDDHLEPVPIGVAGEVFIGGAGLARGYHDRPELTAERFVPDPFSSGERLYRTGDLGRWLPDGNLVFVGRVDRQVKIRGFRVEPAEIEAVFSQHPAVGQVAVIAREHRPGERRLEAFVVAAELTTTTDLQNYAAERLPEHLVPSTVTLLGTFPHTASGKVDRSQLEQQATSEQRAVLAPRDAVELELQRIWEGFFPGRRVGVTDDFFALGGHSLLAMRLVAQIRRVFGRDLPVSSLVDGRTIERLACLLRTQPGPRSSVVALQPHGCEPPLFLVHPVSGTVFCYVELAGALDGRRPIHALEAAGLDGKEPHTSIEDMARSYVAAVQRVQPAGPYLLGGWSMGGLVAFEMARQLEARDQQVALLSMLDTSLAGAAPGGGHDGEDEALRGFVQHLGLSPDELTVTMRDLWQLDPDEQLCCVLQHARRASLVPPDLDLPTLRWHLRVFTANVRAVRAYVPGPYSGRVTLLEAADQPGDASARGARWEELALGGVSRHTLPGDHHTMLRPPHVTALAQCLASCLAATEPVT